jgi:hypothetical protein
LPGADGNMELIHRGLARGRASVVGNALERYRPAGRGLCVCSIRQVGTAEGIDVEAYRGGWSEVETDYEQHRLTGHHGCCRRGHGAVDLQAPVARRAKVRAAPEIADHDAGVHRPPRCRSRVKNQPEGFIGIGILAQQDRHPERGTVCADQPIGEVRCKRSRGAGIEASTGP